MYLGNAVVFIDGDAPVAEIVFSRSGDLPTGRDKFNPVAAPRRYLILRSLATHVNLSQTCWIAESSRR